MKISIVSLLLLLFSFNIFSQQSVESAYPSNPDSVGKLLCQSINLDLPGLEKVKAEATKGKYTNALLAWRDYKVESLRKSYLGPFGWHSNQLNGGTVLPYAQFMAGTITLNQFLASRCEYRNDMPQCNFTGSPENFNWFPKNPAGQYITTDVYSNFYNIIPLASHYYKSGEIVYLNKWFQVVGDFACKQKIQVEKFDNATRKLIMCNWTTNAGPALSQSGRAVNIIRSLGVIFKSLPNGGRPASWDSIYVPVNKQLPAESMELVPPVEFAQIVFSLVFDHPKALLDRFLVAGAAPNQRSAGLTALAFIVAQFPEFKVCTEISKSATAGLDDYLAGAFYKDGGMLEPSFNYNMGDALALGDLIKMLKQKNPDLSQRIENKQINFYRLTAAIRTPLGDLPAMSSQGPSNPTPIWNDVNARTTWQTQVSKGIPGQNDAVVAQIASQFKPVGSTTPPDFTSVRFPYSGYYVQRKSWQWDSQYLFFQDNRPARGHTNMGHNAIQVYAYGRPLLLSAGQPVYGVGQLQPELKGDIDAINVLFSEGSSLKTNTVIVDGNSQNKNATVAQTVYTKPIDAHWHTSANFDFLEGFYDLGYPLPGIVNHRRQITFVRDLGCWIVADIMTNIDSKEHTYSQIWNFPGYQSGDKPAYGFKQDEVKVDANGIHSFDPKGPNVWIYNFGEKPLEYNMYFGQKNPYLGWFAPGFGQLIPAPQVFAKWKSSQNSVLVTIIWPTPNNIAPEYSELKNLSISNDPSYAGFIMTLKDGRKLECQVSHDVRKMKNKMHTVDAQSLFSIYLKDGSVKELVTTQADGTANINEYIWSKGNMQPIKSLNHTCPTK